MEKEIDIVELVKHRRYVKLALRKLLSPAQRMDMKMRTRYRSVEPDVDKVTFDTG